jgi:hypothetical protein
MKAYTERLLATDPGVQQRDVVIDERAMALRLSATFSAEWGAPVDRCERLRVKYRVGENVRALFAVRAGWRTELVAARTFAPARARAVYERAASQAVSSGTEGTVAFDEPLAAVYWTFPQDRKIARLGALAAPAPSLVRALSRAWARTRLVAYAPEKCATARLLAEDGSTLAYAKAYAGDEGGRVYELYRELRAALGERVAVVLPRPIAYSAADRVLLIAPLDGPRVADLASARRDAGFRRLGAALAWLHGIAVVPTLPVSSRLSAIAVARAASIVGRVRPDVADVASRLADDLVGSAAACGPAVVLHGDVHPKNAVWRRDGLGLVDLDQAAAGPAATDLGSLLAALRFGRHTGDLSAAEERALGSAVLAGYAGVRTLPDDASLRWHMAAALFAERALRSLNRMREAGLRRLPEVLADARALAGRGGAL